MGNGATTQVLDFTEAEQVFHFDNIDAAPVPSLLRSFSAPVKLSYPYSREERMFLMQHDSDGFNRWDASQQLAVEIMQGLIEDHQAGKELQVPEQLITAYRTVLGDDSLDKAMVSKILTLPSQAYLSELAEVIDVEAIHAVRKFVRNSLANTLESLWQDVYQANLSDEAYSPDADSIARRSLKNLALAYLLATAKDEYLQFALRQYDAADNMTDQQASLTLVAHSEFTDAADELLDRFYAAWKDEALVVNQWLSVQASAPAEGALKRVEALLEHPAYDAKNPNKIRSLVGAFCGQNPVNFHHQDGSGYAFLADQIIMLNKQNPQIASRLLGPLTRWKNMRRHGSSRCALNWNGSKPVASCRRMFLKF